MKLLSGKKTLASLFTAALLLTAVPSISIAAETADTAPQIVNINEATAQEIADALNGIGMKRAAAIVKYRETNGKFNSLEEITAIKGVGEKTLEKNSDLITLQ